MGLPNIPNLPEPDAAADVKPADYDALVTKFEREVHQLLDDLSTESDKSERPIMIVDHGQVSSMQLPAYWVALPQERNRLGIGSRSILSFHHPEYSDVVLALFYRGLPISPEGGQAFHQLLQEPPHQLSTSEIKSQTEVLQEKADRSAFSLLSAATRDWNGRSVLVVHGVYKTTGNELYDIFVDGDLTGRAIQEIMYQAPKDRYLSYLVNGKAALNSIRWK